MNALEADVLKYISEDLTHLLNKCTSLDQIAVHFASYLNSCMIVHCTIEDYDFIPHIKPDDISVLVFITFPSNLNLQHKLLIRKDDSPSVAYDRAMKVI